MKQGKSHYTPQEFARLFHIDKQTLIYYDNQGIFSPAFRSEKGYRYYEATQILPFAELLSLRNLHISGAEMGVFNQHPSRSKLIELLSDKVMEQEEAIRAMQSNIESLKRKIRHLAESRSHPMEQVMLIPKPVRLMQRSPSSLPKHLSEMPVKRVPFSSRSMPLTFSTKIWKSLSAQP